MRHAAVHDLTVLGHIQDVLPMVPRTQQTSRYPSWSWLPSVLSDGGPSKQQALQHQQQQHHQGEGILPLWVALIRMVTASKHPPPSLLSSCLNTRRCGTWWTITAFVPSFPHPTNAAASLKVFDSLQLHALITQYVVYIKASYNNVKVKISPLRVVPW